VIRVRFAGHKSPNRLKCPLPEGRAPCEIFDAPEDDQFMSITDSPNENLSVGDDLAQFA